MALEITHNCPQTFTTMQCIDCLVSKPDTIEGVRDEMIYWKSPIDTFLNQLRYITPALETSKCSA